MKKVIFFFVVTVLFMAMLAFYAKQPNPIAYNDAGTQVETTIVPAQVAGSDTIFIEDFPSGGNIMDWLSWIWRNWQSFAGVIMLFILAYEPIARLTPTDKDNNFLRVLQSWLDAILPNKKAGGGTFNAFSDPKDAPPAAFVKKD